MNANFKISGIDNKFNHLFRLGESELSSKGAVRMIVDEKPGYPCRVSLEDAEIGEEVILLPFKHHDTNSPYQSSGPIFVRKDALPANLKINEIPKILAHRLLSLRGYDRKGMMVEARITEGEELREAIQAIFNNQSADYIHVHNAGPGCYNCLVNRVA